MRIQTILALAAALAVALVLSPVPAHAGGDPPPAHPLRGSDLKAVIDRAEELRTKDVRAFGKLLISLGDPAPQRGVDLDFLVEYSVREPSRALRMLAIEAADRIDAAGAATAFLKKATEEKNPYRVVLALEAVGLVGGKQHVTAVLPLMKSPSEMIACAAADTIARIGTNKDADAVIDAGLTHPESHVSDHAAWAVQDLLKSQKTALERFQKIASKKSDPRNIRAEATAALIADKAADPHKWVSPFEAARKALLAAPDDVVVKGQGKNAEDVKAAIDWIKEKLPADHWLFCAAVKQVNVPGAAEETRPNVDDLTLDVRLADSVLPPNKIAYLIQRQAVVLWRKKIGEPSKGHRGWEPGIIDSYDLCVVARLYDAGPGGLSRERFVTQILGGRPWGGL